MSVLIQILSPFVTDEERSTGEDAPTKAATGTGDLIVWLIKWFGFTVLISLVPFLARWLYLTATKGTFTLSDFAGNGAFAVLGATFCGAALGDLIVSATPSSRRLRHLQIVFACGCIIMVMTASTWYGVVLANVDSGLPRVQSHTTVDSQGSRHAQPASPALDATSLTHQAAPAFRDSVRVRQASSGAPSEEKMAWISLGIFVISLISSGGGRFLVRLE